MSGHSKWATTKHQKAVKDARRGKLFARLIRAIEVASREGGSNLDGNPTLADAVAKARSNSLPMENIDRAIKRGAGELGGVAYEAVSYEGYAPGGVAVLVECLTDNRNRAASEVRTAFTRNGGSLADPGSVAYLFTRKGVALVPKTDALTEDDVLSAVLDAGAEEVNDLGEAFEVVSDASDVHAVRVALEAAHVAVDSADVSWLPSVSVPLDDEVAKRVLRLVDALEDLDDVQNVYANFDISDEVLESV
ncbi:MAG: YebC/PmpR family DNA-binding transcriptional regulator [Mycobacteriales bacterium]|nr:YebC/PmpR family DNA-binding transcriptional regulator [Frankia sp.]